MILWLPISLLLAFCGSLFLFGGNYAINEATKVMDADTPEWVIAFCKHFFFALFGILAAILLTLAYLLAKLALGL